MSIDQAVDALPDKGITVTVLKTLDYLVPGKWENITDFNQMITSTTGVADPQMVQRIRQKSVALYNEPGNNYARAMRVYSLVDSVDKVVAAAALASKVGEAFSFLSFLDRFTPKADTTQAIDASLKFTAELIAYGLLNGMPKPSNIGEYSTALGQYAKEDAMRLAGWVVIEGVIPLGPDFMRRMVAGVDNMGSGSGGGAKLFNQLSGSLPGNTTAEKKGFLTNAMNSTNQFVGGFVADKQITQQGMTGKLSRIINVADSGLDYVAAALDAGTNYYEHTGTQTVARSVIKKAHWQLMFEG